MAVFRTYNAKGFQIVRVTKLQLASIGSPCICDDCGKPMENSIFVGALNRAYCPTCYEDWENRAVFYDEDKPYEKMATERFVKNVNSKIN